ncbi:MAG: Asd/ArgC dimerization domain-containing protein [Myxococcota bacterium]|nr:Asd/ArgC dimerization domain-containing protein [Myxococcota bacterium]
MRLGLVGATTTLGQEIASVLVDEPDLILTELRAFADSEVGDDALEYESESVMGLPSGPGDFSGLDMVLLASSPKLALDEIRSALRAEIPCIDCSGALLASDEVPLLVAGEGETPSVWSAPLVSTPTDASLAWLRVLRVLDQEVGVEAVSGTVLHSASTEGRAGIEELSVQTLALLSQSEAPPAEVFEAQVAFDCFPHAAESEEGGGPPVAPREAGLARSRSRLMGAGLRLSVTCVQVPAFAGEGSILRVTTRELVRVEDVTGWFEAAPGICVAPEDGVASTREAVGSADVGVARLRSDPSAANPERTLQMWLSADPIRQAAENAVALMRARLSVH